MMADKTTNLNEIRCYNCQKFGHFKGDCKEPIRPIGSCFKCGPTTHRYAKLTEPIEHADWVRKLSQVQYAINNTIHLSTKQTPSKLLFSIEQRGEIIDELTEHLNGKFEIVADLQKIRADAGHSRARSKGYNEEYFLRRSKPADEFGVGDNVVVCHIDTAAGTIKKLQPHFRVVKKKLPYDRYVVTDIDHCQITQMPYNGVIEAKRMRHWVGRQRDSADLQEKAAL